MLLVDQQKDRSENIFFEVLGCDFEILVAPNFICLHKLKLRYIYLAASKA